MGWLTVVAYFLCSVYSFKVVKYSRQMFELEPLRQKYFWLGCAWLMILLGFNKQLDLQTLFTDIGRYMSVKQGWHGQRHTFQKLFIYLMLSTGCICMMAMIYYYARVLRAHALAIVGICCLSVFVLIRASSFHHMDQLIRTDLMGVKMNWILELSGIALVLFNARQLIRKGHQKVMQSPQGFAKQS